MKSHQKCPGCETYFLRKKELLTHIASCRVGLFFITCAYCKEKFTTLDEYKSHNSCSHRTEGKECRAQCVCMVWFPSFTTMIQHLGEQVPCPIATGKCKDIVYACNLDAHTKNNHPRTLPCILHRCKHLSLHKEELDDHLQETHYCVECKELFLNMDEHKTHDHSCFSLLQSSRVDNNILWTTIKCEEHKEERVTREIIQSCSHCRVFPRK